MNAPAARLWSTYQEAVFHFFTQATGNAVVEAVAGSGKTTTLVEGLKRWKAINPTGSAIFVAFNKSIADELVRKVPAGVNASTLHSAGFAAVRKAFRGVRVDANKLAGYAETIANTSTENGQAKRGVAADLVKVYGLLKGAMIDLGDAAACERAIDAQGIELSYPRISLTRLATLDDWMRKDTARVTFDEMLSFIVDHDIAMATYDMVCVDESQDMNLLQIELLRRMVASGGRLCAVGDTFQAIYGFRGADSEAMNRIRETFAVPAENELPLSITYRCARAIVAEAQAYVPHIMPADGAVEGTVAHAGEKDLAKTLTEMADGDMGVCRCNAPLVACALTLVKQGRKATVRGRDIGTGLIKLVRDLKHDGSVNGMLEALAAWESRTVQRFTAARKEAQAQQAADRAETLEAIAIGCETIAEVVARIESIFSDTTTGVVFSSIHKSKGLEATKVVWLNPSLTSFFAAKAREKGLEEAAQQEDNLAYVAITRAKTTLILQAMPRKEI